MAVKDLLGTSYRDLSQMSEKELKSAFRSISHALRERGKTFAKHGREAPKYQKGLGSMRGLSKSEMARKVAGAAAYMRGKVSGYKGYMEAAEEKRQKIQEALPDLDLSSIEKLEEYGKFMDEVAERFPEHRKLQSDAVKNVYREARRLNIDPNRFISNMEFWQDHYEELAKAREIKRTGRPVYPSDYARQLKLGKIK